MREIWLVIKHDLVATLRQRSFWILTLVMPAMLLALNAYYLVRDSGLSEASPEAGGAADLPGAVELPALALVDEAGLISAYPPGVPPDLFTPYGSLGEAQDALRAGSVEQVVHIPADYVATGRVTLYDRDFQIMSSGEGMGVAFGGNQAWVLRTLIDYNLTGDAGLTAALRSPIPADQVTFRPLRPPAEAPAGPSLAPVVSSVMPYIYYFLLLLSSNYLMRSVVAEKENRTVEVLLLSLDPRRMMVGKILAMSGVLLIQLAFWVGSGAWLLRRGAQALNAGAFTFPPGFFVWAALFLVLGYLLFAAVMAAGGALATNIREVSQMTMLLVIPLMPTLMFATLFAEEPESPLVLFLSLFPFSAPSAMVTRLAVSPVPLWQLLASLAGLALTSYFFVLLAARFFRVGNLLSGAPFSWRRFAFGWRQA